MTFAIKNVATITHMICNATRTRVLCMHWINKYIYAMIIQDYIQGLRGGGVYDIYAHWINKYVYAAIV